MIRSEAATRSDDLTANAAELAELVASFPAESLLSPLGDEFCAVEHVCHLRDLERDGLAARIRSVIDRDDPLLFGFDGAGWQLPRTTVRERTRRGERFPRSAAAERRSGARNGRS